MTVCVFVCWQTYCHLKQVSHGSVQPFRSGGLLSSQHVTSGPLVPISDAAHRHHGNSLSITEALCVARDYGACCSDQMSLKDVFLLSLFISETFMSKWINTDRFRFRCQRSHTVYMFISAFNRCVYSHKRRQNKDFCVSDELYLIEVMIFFGFEQMKRFPLVFTGSGQQVIKHVIVSVCDRIKSIRHSSPAIEFTQARVVTQRWKMKQNNWNMSYVLMVVQTLHEKEKHWCDVPLIVLLVN